MKYRIISIDGGGVYGTVSIVFLRRLLEHYPNLIKETDLFAGTSVGGIIALGLAFGYQPEELQNIFSRWTPLVFKESWYRIALSYFGIKPKYTNNNLRHFLTDYFSEHKLSDLKKSVLVPAFSLNSPLLLYGESFPAWRAKFFHNLPGSDSDGEEKIVDIAMYTTAAPTYFPSVSKYIDGCIASNNPALCAICQTQDKRVDLDPRPKLDEITVLSFGKESARNYITGTDLDWGWMHWAHPLIKMFLDNDNRVISYQCRKIIGEHYIRVAPLMKGELDVSIDQDSEVGELIKFAEEADLTPYLEQLKKVW